MMSEEQHASVFRKAANWLRPKHWSVGARLVAMVAPLLILFTLGIALLYPGRQREQLIEEQVTTTAEAVLLQLRADREYYSSVVVPRLLSMNAKVVAEYHKVPGAFPLPATFLR